MKAFIVLVILWSLGATSAAAEQGHSVAPQGVPARHPSPASDGASGVSAILEAEQRYPRTHQLELQVYGGSYLGPSVGSSFITGSRLLFWLTRMVGVGGGYSFSRLSGGHDLGSVSSRQLHIINGQVELSTDAALRLSRSTTLEIDLFGTLGGGAIWIADGFRPTGLIGGGLRVYPGPSWLSIRVDVLNWLHMTPLPAGDSFEADLAFTLTLSFLLPPRQAAWRN